MAQSAEYLKEYKRRWYMAHRKEIRDNNKLNVDTIRTRRKQYYMDHCKDISEKEK